MLIDNFNLEKRILIVAELSANHAEDIEIAKRTIAAAKEAGADAVKLQTLLADTITLDCDNEYFKISRGKLWDGNTSTEGKTLYELYGILEMPWDWQPILKEYAGKLGLIFFSTPFDKTAVDFLEELDVPAYKIASYEITDIPLIEYVAKKGKPVLISTGIATKEDIDLAVSCCRNAGNDQIVLLKCTSSYPADLSELNLLTIPALKTDFNTEVGLSDHSLGNIAPIAAAALGARVIEKHIILDRSIKTPDSGFSSTPDEFRQMVHAVREAERAVGKVNYELLERTSKSRCFARSLFAVKNISAGDVLTEDNIRSIRPNYGLHPKEFINVIGRRARIDIRCGTPIRFDLIVV